MNRCHAATYLAVALASTALATVQPAPIPEAEAVSLFDTPAALGNDDAALSMPVMAALPTITPNMAPTMAHITPARRPASHAASHAASRSIASHR